MAETPQIFLSYSHDDVPFVSAVADELRMKGVSPWSDDDELTAGADWHQHAAEALASSDYVVLFMGGPRDSPWQNFEIGAAVGGNKPVVPVYLTAASQRDKPWMLSDYEGIDAHDMQPREVAQQIADVIRSVA